MVFGLSGCTVEENEAQRVEASVTVRGWERPKVQLWDYWLPQLGSACLTTKGSSDHLDTGLSFPSVVP